MQVKEFSDLVVWQQAHCLAILIYRSSKDFPKDELFGLTAQIRRASVSVTSNIAEGFGRQTYKEKNHFYYMSHGSLAEVQSQLLLARDLNYLAQDKIIEIQTQIRIVQSLLRGLLRSMQQKITSR